MAGLFTQKDSCNGFSQFQTKTVTIVSSISPDITVQKFGSFLPYVDIDVTLDCANHTAIIPTQYPGMVSVWGSGTFASDNNSMTLNYYVDLGTSVKTCIAKYTRGGIGIEEEMDKQTQITVYPNPSEGFITINVTSKEKLSNLYFSVIDVSGRVVKHDYYGNEIEKKIDFSKLEKGIYFITLYNDDKSISFEKFILN